jgi:putative tricarboxylic transport membrane protein
MSLKSSDAPLKHSRHQTGLGPKKGDIFAGLFFLFIGISDIIGALQLPLGTPLEPMPGLFPLFVGIFLSIISVIHLVVSFRNRNAAGPHFGTLRRPASLISGLVIYCMILNVAGYVLSTIFLSAVILWTMETRTWWKLAALSLFLAIASYGLFDRILGIPLPPGILKGLV